MPFIQCKDCVFFKAHGGAFKTGVCRRHAPLPLMIAEEAPEVDEVAAGIEMPAVWPQTRREDGCGDGEKKPHN